MTVFLTSDTHFYHRNIIEYCNRPFRTLDGHPDPEAMNRELIKRWNETVQPFDLVFHLGDFGFKGPEILTHTRKLLNGSIILIKGNHDKKPQRWMKETGLIHRWLAWPGVFMSHVPPAEGQYDQERGRDLRVYTPPEGTKLWLVGHVHEKWAEKEYKGIRVVNVGVDVRNLRPIPANEVQPGLEDLLLTNPTAEGEYVLDH